VLLEHKDDTSLEAAGSTATWPIVPPPDERGWRHFRIHITGPNSSGSTHYISISGLELYGVITDVEVESFSDEVVAEERALRTQRAISRALSVEMAPGVRVGRGPDWKWGNQNGEPDGKSTFLFRFFSNLLTWQAPALCRAPPVTDGLRLPGMWEALIHTAWARKGNTIC
jgi:E3 ubiquitin-protein ligase HECTD1